MGRRERPLDPNGGPLVQLASALRELRNRAGLTYRELSYLTRISTGALSQAASGTRVPSLGILHAYVTACGGDTKDWVARWQRARQAVAGKDESRTPDCDSAEPTPPFRVAVIDDDPAVWEGVSSWLADEPRLLVVGAGDDPIKVLSGANDEVHIILCELRRRGTVALNDVARLVSTGIPVVVFSEHTEPEVMLAMFEVGAVAFLAKHENRQHFIQTLLAAAVHQRHNPRPPAGASLSDYQTARPALSRREREVLLLWLQSMSKASVARRMRVSENTVKQYVDRVRFKYARAGRPAATKAALLARAVEDGLVCTEAVGE